MEREHNWSDTYTYKAARIHLPTSIDEVRRLVAGSAKLRPLGTRHSFNGIADTSGDLIDLAHIAPEFVIDREQQTVTAGAGTRYGPLAQYLKQQGFALSNMASLPHISLAGATATATHGSGDHHGNLSTTVAALEIVTATGDVVQVRRGDRGFDGLAVGLGAFGIITRIALDIEPTFDLRQDAFAELPWDSALSNFDEIMSAGYSVSLLTAWSGSAVSRLWIKTRLSSTIVAQSGPSFCCATSTSRPINAIAADMGDPNDALNPFGVPGPWSDRLCHFRLDCDPGPPGQIQSEYMVPRTHAMAALTRLRAMGDRIDRHLYLSEIRTIAADRLWLSPSYGRDTVAIHFTWRPEPDAVDAITAEIEEKLLPLWARPHWGKLIHAPASVIARLYPCLFKFRSLADTYDPSGKFRNEYLREHVFG